MPVLKPVPLLSQICIDSTCHLLVKAVTDLSKNIGDKNISNWKSTHDKNDRSYIKRSDIRQVHSKLKCPKLENKNNESTPEISSSQNECPENGVFQVDESNHEEAIQDVEYEKKAKSLINQSSLEYIRQQREFIDELSNTMASFKLSPLHCSMFFTLVKLLDPIFNPSKKDMKAEICVILPKFINCCIKELDFGYCKMISDTDVLKAIFAQLHLATGLETLLIPRACLRTKSIVQLLPNILSNLKNLKILHIHYMCNSDIIKNISTNCPLLEELNLNGSEEICDVDIAEIKLCTNLKKLVITGTKVTGMACQQLLKECTSLEILEHCAFNCRSDYVIFESRAELLSYITQHIAQIQQNQRSIQSESNNEASDSSENKINQDIPGDNSKLSMEKSVFNLTYFWLFNPNSDQMQLSLLFPMINHLRLDFVMQDLRGRPELNVISQLSRLEKLTLNMYDTCQLDLVTSLLEICGHSLKHLHLRLADKWFFVAPVHNLIATHCPNLVSLTMEGDYWDGENAEADARLDFTIAHNNLSKLEELKLTGLITDQRLRHILLQAPNLTSIYLDGQLEHLHDSTFTEVLDTNSLCKLESLYVNVSTTLTLNLVERLLKSENKLVNVGRLCHFNSPLKEDYNKLQDLIKSNNFMTNLVWVR